VSRWHHRFIFSCRLLRIIASRVRDEVDSLSGAQSRSPAAELGHDNTNLKTVAVLPSSRNVPINTFARKLHAALESIGASTSYLNQASVSSHLGHHAFTRMGKLKAAGWLADQEQRYRTVLYVADAPVSSSWTQTCIRQVSHPPVGSHVQFTGSSGGSRNGGCNGRGPLPR
jgi:lysophospholipid hydrolase